MASFPFAMIDLYSYPTSRLTVNVAIVGTIVVFTYVAFSLLLKALWTFVKQELTFRGIGADPVANFVHGHAPYVSDSTITCLSCEVKPLKGHTAGPLSFLLSVP